MRLQPPRGGLVARVADQRRERADQEDHFVPQLLELGQLAHRHGVAQVQVRLRRVEAAVDAQRPVIAHRFGQPLAQLGFHVGTGGLVAKLDPAHEDRKLLFNRPEPDSNFALVHAIPLILRSCVLKRSVV